MPSFKPLLHVLSTFFHALFRFIGKVQSTLILTLVYVFFFGPFAIGGKIFRVDFLGKRIKKGSTFWSPRHEEVIDLARAQEPY